MLELEGVVEFSASNRDTSKKHSGKEKKESSVLWPCGVGKWLYLHGPQDTLLKTDIQDDVNKAN